MTGAQCLYKLWDPDVPKFMLRFIYCFMRVGGAVFSKRQYSWDLQQGGSPDSHAFYVFLWGSPCP